MHDGEVIRLHGKVELGVVEPRKVNGSVDRGVSLAGGDSHTIERERVAGEHESSIHFLIPYARRRNARRGVAEIEAAVQTWRVDASFDRDVAVQPSLNFLQTRHHRLEQSEIRAVGVQLPTERLGREIGGPKGGVGGRETQRYSCGAIPVA